MLLEPIQGEGGLRVFPPSFLARLRELCDARGLLLVLDEVQSGVGRTGKFLACEHSGVTPDIVALAKGLGGGFPLGACLATREAAKGMTLGAHGSTFGGNPLAAAVGDAVLDVVLAEGFMERVARLGALLRQRLAELEDRYPDADRGSARRRSDVRPENARSQWRIRRRRPRAGAAHRARRRQCRAPAAAAHHRRKRYRRSDGASLGRLRAAGGAGREIGSGVMTAHPLTRPRSFSDLADHSGEELRRILELAKTLKARRVKGVASRARPLAGKYLGMVFDKPSTRTRVSFDVAMRELGGETIMLTGAEMQLGRGETIADTARVLSRFVDAIMIRILSHEDLTELARYATVPVINGLTKESHPCQVMADVLTFEERLGPIEGRTVAWSGDANNVLASWIHAAARFDSPSMSRRRRNLRRPTISSPGRKPMARR